jgi:type II secretory ATPase GspE/PulE/Tfp pilus assembly ATPase PilB-like protein
MKPVGCEKCEGQGYCGRISVHELMTSAPEIKRVIKQSLGVELITELAMQQGMRSLRMDDPENFPGHDRSTADQ